MREIKFRAWENGIMHYQVRCGGVFDGIPTAPTCWDGHDWTNLTGQPHTKVMQWTWLKDKNGVEVYEGDLYKNPLGNKMKIVFEIREAGFMGESLRTGKKFSLLNFNGYLNGEVIGNIYENPELLEVK